MVLLNPTPERNTSENPFVRDAFTPVTASACKLIAISEHHKFPGNMVLKAYV